MKRAKRLIAAVSLIAVVCAMLAAPVFAAGRYVTVVLNGKQVDFLDTSAQIIDNYTYVPIARIIEILTGSPPDWDPNARMASFSFNGKQYKIYASQQGIYVDNIFMPFDAPPVIKDNRTLIPLRMLSEALGFGISWDSATSTASLTSPSAPVQPAPAPSAQATVVSAEPSGTSVAKGTVISVAVVTSGGATEVKIVDSSGMMVSQTKTFQPEGANKRFVLNFAPAASGTFRAYAASPDGYNTSSYKEFNMQVGADLTITGIDLSSSTVALGDTLTLNIYTTIDVTRVRLESDFNANDYVESSSSTTNGNQRVFVVEWTLRSSYYSDASTVSAKVYAGGYHGYADEYKAVTVNVGSKATIYEAVAEPSTIDTDSESTISVTTDQSIASVSFSVLNGNGRMSRTRVTTYHDSGDYRYWENTFYSGGTDGTANISITAEQNSGGSVSKTVWVTITTP